MIAKSQIEVVGKPTFCDEYSIPKGPFLYYVRVGGQENGNFPLLYVVKMSLQMWVGGSKKPQNTLT